MRIKEDLPLFAATFFAVLLPGACAGVVIRLLIG